MLKETAQSQFNILFHHLAGKLLLKKFSFFTIKHHINIGLRCFTFLSFLPANGVFLSTVNWNSMHYKYFFQWKKCISVKFCLSKKCITKIIININDNLFLNVFNKCLFSFFFLVLQWSTCNCMWILMHLTNCINHRYIYVIRRPRPVNNVFIFFLLGSV